MTTSLVRYSLLGLGLAIAAPACKDDSGLTGDDDTDQPDAGPGIDAPPGVKLVDIAAGDIAGDTHWTADTIYTLKGYVFVTSGTLTIDAGTLIKGDNGSALTITKDAKLDAVGTADKPIVFTSSAAVPESGDWGGVVMLGKAPINVTGGTNKIEGFATSFGERITYGAAAPSATHDCGKLTYARIEYAGFALAVDNELNGLTVAGCGTATEIDYVQSHLGLDDGIEVFGGTVHLKHLVISQPDDDALDWDFGWTGRAQFVIIQQKQGRGDKGFEADNNVNNNDLTPRSMPEIWNATMIGGDGPTSGKKQGAMHMRRGTAGKVSNAIVAYWNQFAVDVDGLSSVGQFGTGLVVKHTYFVKSTNAAAIWPTDFDVSSGSQNDCQSPNTNCFDEVAQIGGDATNHLDVDPMLGDAKNIAAPNFKPAANSPVLTGCGTPPSGFDQTATYCGAIGGTDWTVGWTKFSN
ncbi:MAG: hypothetical protein AB7O24_17000 [Kofleriaceae bacterium]